MEGITMKQRKIVIFNYTKNAEKPYLVSIIDEKYNIVQQCAVNREELIGIVMTQQLKTINFSINRKNEIVEDCGALTRLKNKIGALVILATVETKEGSILGYKVISSANGQIFNLDLNSITKLYYERANTKDNVLFQNGIVRLVGNNKLTISCFPMKPFDKIIFDNKKESKKEKVEPKVTKSKTVTQIDKPIEVELNEKQCKEIERCRKAGVNPSILSDPRLSDRQMRILWVAKSKKGSYVECFANADFSEDAMKFYADRVYDKETADKYKMLLDRPDLDVDKLQELTAMIDDGIPCEDLLNKTSEEIYCERISRGSDYDNYTEFGRIEPNDLWKKGNLYDFMVNEAMKLGTDLMTEKIKID